MTPTRSATVDTYLAYLPMHSRLVEVPRPHDTAVYVADTAEAYAEGIEPQTLTMAAVVQAIMMMAVERLADAEAAGQFVDGVEPMRV